MIRSLRRLSVFAVVSALLLVPAPAHADEKRDRQWYLGFLKIAEAHRHSQGAGVRVAVVDSGIDATHPDLSSNVLPGTDLVTEGSGDGRRDTEGHGTGMASLIAAHGRGGNGVLGIAPQAKVLPVRITSTRIGGSMTLGINWAVQQKVDVISLSIGGDRDTPDLRRAVDAALAADIVVVAGAGNAPRELRVMWPAAYSGVVAVAGVDRNGNHAEVSVTGNEVVLAAPAVDIYSCSYGNAYQTATGTSDSTAMVAGVAALVRAKYPDLSAKEVVRRMTATAIDKGSPGRDFEYGYGIVDPVAALTRDVAPLPSASATAAPAAEAGEPAGSTGNRTGVLIMVIGAGVLLIALVAGAVIALARRRPAQ